MPIESSDADFDIVAQGGGGDGVVSIHRFWVHAPPDPEMSIYVTWPALDIEETNIRLDTSALVEASDVSGQIPGW